MTPDTRWALEVRWARDKGWLRVVDPSTGQPHELRAADAPKWMVRRAMDAKQGPGAGRAGRSG